MYAIDNGGKGTNHAERLVYLRMCLKGTRRMVYDNVIKSHKDDGMKETNPQQLYKEIKDELMQFAETAVEKQVRIRNQWRSFSKTKYMTALEFSTKFIKFSTQLEEVGLGLSKAEKYMCYIEKVGADMAELIRLDKCQRPDRSGGTSERLPETWEEAHAVLMEREAARSGTKILKEHSLGEPPKTYPDGYFDKDVKPSQQAGGSEQRTVCFNMRDKGKCEYGDRCKFSHDKTLIADARRKGNEKGRPDKRKKILCKYIKDPSLGECPDGDDCPYNHDPNSDLLKSCLLYTSPSPRDGLLSRMPSSA